MAPWNTDPFLIHTSISAVGRDVFQTDVANYTLNIETATAVVFININNDDVYEADEESLVARIILVSSGRIDPERQEATVTIVDEDGKSCKYMYHMYPTTLDL